MRLIRASDSECQEQLVGLVRPAGFCQRGQQPKERWAFGEAHHDVWPRLSGWREKSLSGRVEDDAVRPFGAESGEGLSQLAVGHNGVPCGVGGAGGHETDGEA